MRLGAPLRTVCWGSKSHRNQSGSCYADIPMDRGMNLGKAMGSNEKSPRKALQAVFEAMLEGDLPIDDTFREGVMSVVGVEVTYGLLRRYNRIK